MKKLIVTLLIGISLASNAQTAIQDFSLPNAADGKMVSLNGQSAKGIVVLFTNNNCPYDAYYTSRIKSLIATYQGKIQFLLVNSFVEPEESMDMMKEKYNSWGLSVPYLADKDQVVMGNLGAKKSTEAFLIKNAGGKYSLSYSGAIDDNPQVAQDAKQNYLKNAIDKLLAGQTPDVSVRAVGCTIRKK